ncbi:MAG: hypothetical protein QM820_35625 [Minicystis sp.]
MAAGKKSKSSPKPTKPKKAASKAPDPTTDAALLALSPDYAAFPDIPIAIAQRELTSLVRLALSQATRLGQVGISKSHIENLALFTKRLAALEKSWQKAKSGVKLTPAQKKLRDEAEQLDGKLVAGGRWALRKDEAAQAELSRIAEGSGLADTIQDLRDLVDFWAEHGDAIGKTDITKQDLARAKKLADDLDEAAAHESSNVDAAEALDLRNRCFWAADELAAEIREGGRYAFRGQPAIAAKFVSRYRASANRRARRKASAGKAKTAKASTGKVRTGKTKTDETSADAAKAPKPDTANGATKRPSTPPAGGADSSVS